MSDSPATATAVTGSETAPRVLVVDDVEDNRDLLRRRLERRGFVVSTASDGVTALERIDTASYDVVLLDWMMPSMSGLEVLDAIRERFSKTELPVLMATAKTESDAVVEALERGANDYVAKPIDVPVLVARLHAQLSMRRELAGRDDRAIDVRNGIAPGTVIDERYEIGDKIGEGGFAAVYKARQISTGQTVAFKLLLPHRARRSTGDVELVRFLREMKVIAQVEHPGVVRLVDSGQVDILHDDDGPPPQLSSHAQETVVDVVAKSGTQRSGGDSSPGEVGSVPYIVMEYLDGRSLSSLIEAEAPLSVERACDLAIPILSALGAAHDEGIVHRDIKPHNVLLVRDHRGREMPKVLDFGIAKITERGVDELTQSDSFIGTPEYMSPEQGRGRRDVDGRADLFSVGAVIYQAVTGRRLYAESSFLAMIHAVAAADFAKPAALGCVLPEDFEAVLLRALSLEREDRQQSARQLALELLPFASDSTRRRFEDELRAPTTAPADRRPSNAGRGPSPDDGEGKTDVVDATAVRHDEQLAEERADPADTERMQALTTLRTSDPSLGPPKPTNRLLIALAIAVAAAVAYLLLR